MTTSNTPTHITIYRYMLNMQLIRFVWRIVMNDILIKNKFSKQNIFWQHVNYLLLHLLCIYNKMNVVQHNKYAPAPQLYV